jgi:hypothetical protein
MAQIIEFHSLAHRTPMVERSTDGVRGKVIPFMSSPKGANEPIRAAHEELDSEFSGWHDSVGALHHAALECVQPLILEGLCFLTRGTKGISETDDSSIL